MILFGFILLIFIMLTGIPVGVCFGIVSIYYFLSAGMPMTALVNRMVSVADSFVIMAIPLYMLLGMLMSTPPVVRRLVNLADAAVGHLTAGLAQVNIVGSMIFAGMSGSSSADAAGLGNVEIRMMHQQGYPKSFAGAVTAASACIGPLIPPSLPFVLYGALSRVSVAQLFMAGAIPGVGMGLIEMVTVWFLCRKGGYPKGIFSWKRLFNAMKDSLPEMMMPIILIGGLVSGMFTPTESAAVAVFYGIVLLFGIRRELKWKEFRQVVLNAAAYTGIFMFIVCLSYPFAWILISEKVGETILAFVTAGYGRTSTILMIIGALLVLGMFLETDAALMITVPILAPISGILQIDPIHLGSLVVLVLQVGLITPPVGMVMYITCTVAEITVVEFLEQIWPFILAMLVLVMLVAFIPELSTFLPRLIVR